MTIYDRHLRPRLPWEKLTRRESDVVDWAKKGYDNGEIAEILGISEQTIKKPLIKHVQKIRN